MDTTDSIAEGVFVFKPKEKKSVKKRKPGKEFESLEDENWYRSYVSVWNSISAQVNEENDRFHADLYRKVNEFAHSTESETNTIPTIIMLAGVNIGDHRQLFDNIDEYMMTHSKSYVATLLAEQCTNVRNMIESMVKEFVTTKEEESDVEDDSEEDSDNEDGPSINSKRANHNLPYLVNWFNNLGADQGEEPSRKKMKNEEDIAVSPRFVVILPDFEAHNEKVLQDFILIMSGYTSQLPLVFIFGVASMISAVHDSLPSHVISKLSFETFKSPPSIDFLNSAVDAVFLKADCPFQLSGSVFKFLTEAFLYYDFSLHGFIRSMQFCIMEHFYESNVALFCCPRKDLPKVISSLTTDQISALKKVPSFERWIDQRARSNQPSLKMKDFKEIISKLLTELHDSVQMFYIGLHCLQILVHDLPGKLLGSELRNLYIEAMKTRITENKSYQECMKLLKFQSRQTLLKKLDKIVDLLDPHTKALTKIQSCHSSLKKVSNKLKSASLVSNSKCGSPIKNSLRSPTKVTPLSKRADLNKYLEEAALKQKTDFEIERDEALTFLSNDIIDALLIRLSKLPFHESMIYTNVGSVKEHIAAGAPRADLYRALNNPQHYLQCECCVLKNQTEILKTMPDICIVYKLHLMWGSLINVYDWMQNFRVIVDPKSKEEDEIRPDIQARFTQAVADLQFLGYIKHTNVKKDHVARLAFETAG